MSSILRTLESWTTHQDYAWFLAVLAWGSIAAGVWRRAGGGNDRWLLGWAFANMGSAIAEMHLLASDVDGPYVAWDRAMLVAQGIGTVCVGLQALVTAFGWRASKALAYSLLAVIAAGALRLQWPVAGGLCLVLLHACAVRIHLRAGLRLSEDGDGQVHRLRGWALQGSVVWLLLAPHGPLAHALDMGRINQDFSRFGLVASTTLAASGAALCMAVWRHRLLEAQLASGQGREIRIRFRRSVTWLAGWLAAGLILIVWSGRVARRSFEASLLARIRTAVQVLEPQLAARALGPALAAGPLRERRVQNATNTGPVIEQMQLPFTTGPDFQELRSQLKRVATTNPDITFVFLTTIREGRLILPATGADVTAQSAWRWVLGRAQDSDRQHLARREAFLEGPFRTPWGPFLAAKAPVLDPVTLEALGWLEFRLASTHWLATFTQARLQSMALVGLGVALWGLLVAYELRRSAVEAAARRAAAAAEADRLKSAFLANVSHELRTPIQSVLGYGELLAAEPLAIGATRWVAALRTHGQIMLQLVNDLIDHGALQSGLFRLQPRPTDLRRLIDDSLAAVAPQASAKRLNVEFELEGPLPERAFVDPVRLRQILLNLLANAVKFTPTGEVRLRVVACRGERTGHVTVTFIVSDTGPGIAPEHHDALFRPFSRFVTDGRTEGTGLGLALVAGLCRNMGGSVKLDTTASPGATFVVTLPLEEAASPGAVAASRPSSSDECWRGVRILVAEDNPLVQELLVAFLSRHGAEVTAVSDGDAAVAACGGGRRFHVVLLDWMMPGQDGRDVARTLRRMHGAEAPFLIGLSAHAQSNGFALALEAGMHAFVRKPVELAALAEIIAQAPGVPPLSTAVVSDDATLFAKLQTRFASELPRSVAEIEAAAARGHRALLYERAHFLKNSADIVGATPLARACHGLCSAAQSSSAALAPALAEFSDAVRHPFDAQPQSDPLSFRQT